MVEVSIGGKQCRSRHVGGRCHPEIIFAHRTGRFVNVVGVMVNLAIGCDKPALSYWNNDEFQHQLLNIVALLLAPLPFPNKGIQLADAHHGQQLTFSPAPKVMICVNASADTIPACEMKDDIRIQQDE